MTEPTWIAAAGGRRLAAYVQGQGEQLVLLEVGLGAESASWAAVADGISRFARVCFYDRAGRGRSDPATKPRQPEDLVQDLRLVVQALSPSRPVLLVGQSLGGLIVRLYAAAYPGDVAGIVLADSLHEDQFERCSPLFPPATEGEPPMLTGMRRFWSGGWRDSANNAEGIDMLPMQAAGRRIGSLGSVPMRVLTAGGFMVPGSGFGEAGPKLQAAWDELHARLAALSDRSRHHRVEDSGHFMQTDRPEAIIEEVRDLVRCKPETAPPPEGALHPPKE